MVQPEHSTSSARTANLNVGTGTNASHFEPEQLEQQSSSLLSHDHHHQFTTTFPSIHSSPQSLLSLAEFHASQVNRFRELYKASQDELTLERGAKRKAEDEVDRERAMRRKLEDQIWEMKTKEKGRTF